MGRGNIAIGIDLFMTLLAVGLLVKMTFGPLVGHSYGTFEVYAAAICLATIVMSVRSALKIRAFQSAHPVPVPVRVSRSDEKTII